MKLSTIAVSAFAASAVSARYIHIPDIINDASAQTIPIPEDQDRPMSGWVIIRPAGDQPSTGDRPSPMRSLKHYFAKLGLVRPKFLAVGPGGAVGRMGGKPCHGHGREHQHEEIEGEANVPTLPTLAELLGQAETHHHPSPEDVRVRIEEMVEHAKHRMEGEGFVPLLQGGMVRILPAQDGPQRHGRPQHWHGEGLHGKHGWHHRHPHSFSGRLNRALRSLNATESLALAFVLGAGIGSILHFLFMLFLLLSRRFRMSRGERCAARAARREARRKRKQERRDRKNGQGQVRLEGEDLIVCRMPLLNPGEEAVAEIEELPRYEAARVEGAPEMVEEEKTVV